MQVGGLVLGELRGFDPSFSIGGTGFYANGTPHLGGRDSYRSVSQYSNARSRDASSFDAFGPRRTRCQDAVALGRSCGRSCALTLYGSGSNSTTGSLGSLSSTFNTTAGTSSQRETTIVNKAFIQFAGLTAGYAQSMFDFYANAYNFGTCAGPKRPSRCWPIRRPSATALGDAVGRRSGVAARHDRQHDREHGRWRRSRSAALRRPLSRASRRARGSRKSSAISASISLGRGAAHGGRASESTPAFSGLHALRTPPTTYAFPALTSNYYGFAIQGGLQLNADYLSPGDKLWLQAAYEKGAFSYIAGNNLGFNYGAVNQNRYIGSAFTPIGITAAGWNAKTSSDCVFTGSGTCEQQWGWDITGAYKHYWLPILASAIYGSYIEVHYPGDALAGFGGAVGISNIKEGRVGTNLVWTPLKGFDIGAEFMYVHVHQIAAGWPRPGCGAQRRRLPVFQPNTNQYEGRLRIQRAF